MDTVSRFLGSSALDSFITSVYKGAENLPMVCMKPLHTWEKVPESPKSLFQGFYNLCPERQVWKLHGDMCARKSREENHLSRSESSNVPGLLPWFRVPFRGDKPGSTCTNLVWPLPASQYTPGSSDCTWDHAHWCQRAFYWSSRCRARALPLTGSLRCFHCDLGQEESVRSRQMDRPPKRQGQEVLRNIRPRWVGKGISGKWAPMSPGEWNQNCPFRPKLWDACPYGPPALASRHTSPQTPTSMRSISLSLDLPKLP